MFGVVLAPDGPLAFLPLPRLEFDPVAVTDGMTLVNVNQQQRAVEGELTRLADVCVGDYETHRTAMWTFVTLGTPPEATSTKPLVAWAVPWRIMVNPTEKVRSRPVEGILREQARFAELLSPRKKTVAALAEELGDLTDQLKADTFADWLDGGFLYPRVSADVMSWCVMVSTPVKSP